MDLPARQLRASQTQIGPDSAGFSRIEQRQVFPANRPESP